MRTITGRILAIKSERREFYLLLKKGLPPGIKRVHSVNLFITLISYNKEKFLNTFYGCCLRGQILGFEYRHGAL